MMPPPKDLTETQRTRWLRAIQTLQELSEAGCLVSGSVSSHGQSGTVWEAHLRRAEDGTYAWSGPQQVDPSESTDWFSFWIEVSVDSIRWKAMQCVVTSFRDASVHLPQMAVEDGVCRAPVEGVELEFAVVYRVEPECGSEEVG